MAEETTDVKQEETPAADTATDSSTETKDQPESSTEDVKDSQEENAIPRDRFNEVNDQKKHYKELYEQAIANADATPEPTYQGNSDMDELEQMRQFQEFTTKTAEAAVERRLNLERTKKELGEVSKKEDFGLVASEMNRILKEKPTYSVTDAYELAKVRSGVFEDQLKTQFSKAEKQRGEEADRASGEDPGPVSHEDPKARVEAAFEKDSSGKFKYSTAELKDMLKGKL